MRESERRFSPEGEKLTPHIRLEFFRHDDKAKATTSGDRTGDEYVRLTPKGRLNATETGKEKDPNPEGAIIYGSSRERSIETAYRHMLANEDAITPDMSLEEIRGAIDNELKVGKKEIVTDQLNFDWDGTQEFHDAAYPHYLESKDALIFLWKESDELVKQLNDLKSKSYSRTAANVADLVKKYLQILPRWQQIVENNKDGKYVEFGNEMQRFFGSHATVTETFLMKVIEKIEGPKGVEEFLDSLADKNGFGFSEGYTIDVSEEDGKPFLKIRFRDNDWSVDENIINEILTERDELDDKITQKLENN